MAPQGATRRRNADAKRYLAPRAPDRAHDAGLATLGFRRRRLAAAGPPGRANSIRVEAGARRRAGLPADAPLRVYPRYTPLDQLPDPPNEALLKGVARVAG